MPFVDLQNAEIFIFVLELFTMIIVSCKGSRNSLLRARMVVFF
ncbi:hypothetical protein PORCRE_1661 [Porphyromonas crevioricanis JCM 15906]|uniref:Uncharacterized protein n=1 Tax=Porphyromonas crevioricanis JCM 15906 TaxID=1305617 RepID=T1CQ18_9PORP|nr:hypothetical protein PORCRE_1661 [Porphyromonas crevioricanis JCM 15906]GAD08337.1 hypothetical protein PORCAN_1979 [Porphyromonas crevioricanis JCM 13913]